MFKILIDAIKLRRLNKLLSELCDSGPCSNCPSYIGFTRGNDKACAQIYVCEQALQKWGLEKKEE